MKEVTHHRALTYLLQERTLSSYSKLMNKEYRNTDLITGETAWCDFTSELEWGEIVLAHQENLSLQDLRKDLFNLDIQDIEKRFPVKISKNSLPPALQDAHVLPAIAVDTHSAIEKVLIKKLSKKYNYETNGYLNKGTLIISLFDVCFGGFINDLEIRFKKLDLESLKTLTESLVPNSSFRKVLIVDCLVAFELDPANYVYNLFDS
jgi:hypothetical protein